MGLLKQNDVENVRELMFLHLLRYRHGIGPLLVDLRRKSSACFVTRYAKGPPWISRSNVLGISQPIDKTWFCKFGASKNGQRCVPRTTAQVSCWVQLSNSCFIVSD
ncbi:hypothetical protein V6N11_074558 [Hibiscus sabdariffa]|uniref:Uncharacterized protein n=1 Tax=Hibiscus sabdariffa TaxID=183260 RepID=A0ABR2R3V2_9ROSI